MAAEDRCLRSIRRWVSFFIVGLVLSGVTAFPLVHELHWLLRVTEPLHVPVLASWLLRVSRALDAQAVEAPFLAYGTDWLAFGHLVIAAAFLGLWRDPVRNRWLVTWVCWPVRAFCRSRCWRARCVAFRRTGVRSIAALAYSAAFRSCGSDGRSARWSGCELVVERSHAAVVSPARTTEILQRSFAALRMTLFRESTLLVIAE